MGRVEVLTGVERRRRWSDDEKQAIVVESFAAGATVAQVAARHDLHPNQLWTWRRLARLGQLAGSAMPTAPFMPVAVVDVVSASSTAEVALPTPALPSVSGLIEIDLGDGRRLRVDRKVDAAALRRVLAVLSHR